ncbi:hypothetical protein ACFPRL_36385 [Pseudoclavibacter helvolus]
MDTVPDQRRRERAHLEPTVVVQRMANTQGPRPRRAPTARAPDPGNTSVRSRGRPLQSSDGQGC